MYREFLLVEKELRKYARTYHGEDYDRLRSIPGIGPIVSIAVLSEIGDIRRFKRIDELCSFVGLIPNIHQSGETTRVSGLTHRSHFLLRTYFVESAWIAVRKDPELIAYYKKFSGKLVANKIIVKVARKLLIRMFYCLKHQENYKVNYNNQKK